MSTEQEHWKLVDPSEAMGGDEHLTERYNWERIECLDCDLDGLREHLKMFGLIVRSRMTGAEVHAEELLSLAGKGLELMDEAADHDDPTGEHLPRLCQEYREAYCAVLDKIDP